VRDDMASLCECPKKGFAVGDWNRRQDRYARRHRRNFASWQGSQTFRRVRTRHNDRDSGGNSELLNRLIRHLIFLGALAVLALPAPAFASADQVIRDCVLDGKLDHNYSNSELRKARNNLPTDLDEYSDCRDVIAAAIKGGSDRGLGAGSPGVDATDPAGEAAAKAEDQADLAAIASGKGPKPSVDVGGTNLSPDSSGFFNLGGAANEVPLPLLLALILLSLFALASGLGALRERVPALASVPFLSKIPTPRVPFLNRRR
jgi:hypothetical protein